MSNWPEGTPLMIIHAGHRELVGIEVTAEHTPATTKANRTMIRVNANESPLSWVRNPGTHPTGWLLPLINPDSGEVVFEEHRSQFA